MNIYPTKKRSNLETKLLRLAIMKNYYYELNILYLFIAFATYSSAAKTPLALIDTSN